MPHERLSVQDRLFLDVEDPLNNMHIAGCFLFEAGPLAREGPGIGVDIEKLCAYIESRLYRIPRYRQRIEYTPLENHPIWVDDENFNILYHVRHTRLPLPGDERQLKRLCGRIVSQQLDRHKPLWELWVVEGLEGERLALVSKVHHCMADGISGVDLLQNLLLTTPEKTFDPAPMWFPQPAPEASELLWDSIQKRARAPFAAAGALLGALRDPRDAFDRARHTVAGLAEVQELSSRPASETPFNRRLGPHRRYDWLAFDLDEVRAVRGALGGTVNDVVLATVAGAVGRFFELRGITQADQRPMDFRVACPVNTRHETDRETYGNQVSMIFAPLPIDERDPVRRLERVREAMETTKRSHQRDAMQTISDLGEWTSPNLVTAYARRTLRKRGSNLVVTNVPGPTQPLYMLGARMLATYPVVPLMPEQALAIALFSYCGGLYWGINSDWDLIPDLHDFILAIETSHRELLAAAESAQSVQTRTD